MSSADPVGARRPATTLSLRFVVLVLLAAFVLRVAAGVALNLAEDGSVRGFQFYGEMARSLLDGDGMRWRFYRSLGFKYANRSPLYPLLLTGIWKLGGTGAGVLTICVQAALASIGCLIPAWLARRWAGVRAARVALVVAALWPYAIVIDTALVEHVLYAPLVLASALAVMRARDAAGDARALTAGLLAGAAALARITFGLCLPLLAISLLVRRGGLRATVLMTVAACVVLSPWLLRNLDTVGKLTPGTDGGRALWLSNHPGTFAHYPDESIDETEFALLDSMEPERMQSLRALAEDEVAQDAVFRRMAVENIAARPAAVAWGGLRKLGALWSPVYNPRPRGAGRQFLLKAVVHGATLTLLVGLSLLAVARVPNLRADLPVLLALAVGFSVAAAVFWGQPRYLAPLHGLGIAAAACAVRFRGDAA